MPAGSPPVQLPPHPTSDFRWREQFTFSWLHAICAPNLALPIRPEVDDGVDAVIKFRRQNAAGIVEAQLKSVTPEQASRNRHDDTLRYYLSRTRAERLTESTTFPVGLFAVVEVPADPHAWCLRHDGAEQHLRLFNRSWWSLIVREGVRVPDALTARTTLVDNGTSANVRIDLHDEGHLDALSLSNLLDSIAAWQRRGLAA